ncbi:hypothetical protein GOBAR_AA26110 [Gossypium barbadense]|uniref:Uncharacterized protein n=1 Tax=Gossypium barbadense TaxID=3634 RepID=A0A2P5WTZ4_GOSBA|nr:hypothetical protein GOBAR_AA26110 [Gossypium barbadense]
MKFPHKWLECRHAPLDHSNVEEEKAPTEDTTVLEILGTVHGSSNTSTVVDQRPLKLFSNEITANDRQIKDLKACNSKQNTFT